MHISRPVILLVTTQTWLQLTRLALRLSRYGCQVSALCPIQSELRFLDRLHSCHLFRPAHPLHSIKAAIIASGATHVVPGDDLAVWLLQELSERSPHYRPIVERSMGPRHVFSTVRSRVGLLEIASSLGIDVPQTVQTRTLGEAREWARVHPVPFLLKKDGTFGGGGVQVVNDAAALDRHYARLNAGPRWREQMRQALAPSDNMLRMPLSWISEPEISAQAYVEGTAANAMFACDRGKILGTVQARVVAAKGKTGPAVMIDLLDDERITRAGTRLASSLQLSGFFGLDFILEQGTGRPMLIELNPRCTQMGHVALAGQPDLAALLWSRWSGEQVAPVTEEALAPSICFYPQALAWDANSSFLKRARLDVCAEDRALVDVLAQGDPAPLARLYRFVYATLKRLKHALVPSRPAPIYYFEPALAGAGNLGESRAFPGNYPGTGTRVSIS